VAARRSRRPTFVRPGLPPASIDGKRTDIRGTTPPTTLRRGDHGSFSSDYKPTSHQLQKSTQKTQRSSCSRWFVPRHGSSMCELSDRNCTVKYY
jgi:hypothetical protein